MLAQEQANPDALFVKAKIDLAEDKRADALAALRQVIDERPEWAQAHFLLGSVLFLDGDHVHQLPATGTALPVLNRKLDELLGQRVATLAGKLARV